MNKINVRLASRAYSELRNDPLSKINDNLRRLELLCQQQTGVLDPVALLQKANAAIRNLPLD
jgi:hypothetical protein